MGLRDQFVNLLKAEAGYHEGWDATNGWNNIQKYSEQTPGFAWSDGQPWCATFECWGAWKCAMTSSWPMTASCSTAVQWWQDHGRWTEWPVLGGPFYMGPGGGDHTGIVYKYDADSIWTVEGNTNNNGSYQGDGVYLRVRPRRGTSSPYGYGVPAYPEGTVSADPALGGTTATEVPPLPSASVRISLPHVITAAECDPGLPQGGTTYPHDVNVVEVALTAEGLLADQYAHDGSYGTKTIAAYAAWQQRLGYSGSDADGIPGRTSLTKLGAKHGFTVA